LFRRILRAHWDDPAQFDALAEALRDWEPHLDPYIPPRFARLFEPDGTLSAICLGDSLTIATDRRRVTVSRGDAIVVPSGLALDAEPEVKLLGIRYDGPPPDHFRERFIQVWGFEHFPAPARPIAGQGFREVIPVSDVRHRVPYAVWDLSKQTTALQTTGLHVALMIGLEGGPSLLFDDQTEPETVAPGLLVAIGPGLSYRLAGPGRVGRLFLMTEMIHNARRDDPSRAMSPEYPPGAGFCSGT
jgi:hypothetical protein